MIVSVRKLRLGCGVGSRSLDFVSMFWVCYFVWWCGGFMIQWYCGFRLGCFFGVFRVSEFWLKKCEIVGDPTTRDYKNMIFFHSLGRVKDVGT